ncbi:MAG: alcohol dehydrogenase catalytic domain-containing protein [Candidatus Hydrogenedentes bacterium]|nr:alcohol dehydrogenase catalytic domain-containing protein [Candidatus Hydrogenedentota bacterium]
MKAVVFDEQGLCLKDIPLPKLQPGEALVKVLLGGLCRTDIEICNGYMNFRGVLGHEFVGVVEEAEDKALIGKRVVSEINCPCYQCEMCRVGEYRHCYNRTVLGIYGRDGVFAEYASIPVANLHTLPDAIPNEFAVFTEPLAACYRVLEQIQVKPTDSVVVLGDGKMGQLLSQVLSPMVSKFICIGKYDKKLRFLKELNIGCCKFRECRLPFNADIVIDATGNPTALEYAIGIVKPRGVIVLKSTVADCFKLNLSRLVVNEVTILGSRCGRFEPAIKSLSSGMVKVDYLISGIYDADNFLVAFEKAKEKESLKVLIRFG